MVGNPSLPVSVTSERGEGSASVQPAAQQQDLPADLHPHSGGSEVVLHEGPRERCLAADGGSAGIHDNLLGSE